MPDVTTEANADVTSDLLHRCCICLSINPNKPYSISMQAVTKLTTNTKALHFWVQLVDQQALCLLHPSCQAPCPCCSFWGLDRPQVHVPAATLLLVQVHNQRAVWSAALHKKNRMVQASITVPCITVTDQSCMTSSLLNISPCLGGGML